MSYKIEIYKFREDLKIKEIQSKLEVERVAMKMKIAGYESSDETRLQTQKKKITIKMYNRVLRTVIENMIKRFLNNNELIN